MKRGGNREESFAVDHRERFAATSENGRGDFRPCHHARRHLLP